MTLLVALLLAAQTMPADRATLDAFRAACARVGDAAQMRADALAAGWVEIEEATDPRIARLLGDGRASLPAGAHATSAVFRSAAGGPDLFLLHARIENEAGWRSRCRLYQFGAGGQVDPALLEQWMARPPTRSEELAEGSSRVWDPGWGAGMSVEIVHVVQSPESRALGFDGNANIFIARAAGAPQ